MLLALFNLLTLLNKMLQHLIEVMLRNCVNLNISPTHTLQSNTVKFPKFHLFKKNYD